MNKKNQRKKSGQGLRALLKNIELDVNESASPDPNSPTAKEVVQELSNNFAMLPLDQIEVNPHQPRNDFDETALQELADSIKIHGLIQPITVRRMAEGQYQLISGERRLRASKQAELTEIPAFIRLANDAEMMEMALIENTHRQDLNDIEVAITFQRLIDEFSLTHENLSERIGKSRSAITNYLRLLKLPPNIQKALKDRLISAGHARQLLSLEDVVWQTRFLERIIEEGLSVREIERLVKAFKQPQKKSAEKKSSLPIEYQDVQDNLSKHFSSKVHLKRNAKTGQGSITINFMDDEDLNRLLEILE